MFEKIVEIIVNQLGCESDTVTEESGIFDELGADSLDIVEILMAVEEKFGVVVPDEEIPNMKTINDIVSYVEANM